MTYVSLEISKPLKHLQDLLWIVETEASLKFFCKFLTALIVMAALAPSRCS